MYIVFVATWSCRILFGNSGDGGSEGDEYNGDVIDSCDSGYFAGGFGGHDGLRVMKDFNGTSPQASWCLQSFCCIMYPACTKETSYVGSISSKLIYKGFILHLHFFQRVISVLL